MMCVVPFKKEKKVRNDNIQQNMLHLYQCLNGCARLVWQFGSPVIQTNKWFKLVISGTHCKRDWMVHTNHLLANMQHPEPSEVHLHDLLESNPRQELLIDGASVYG